MFQVDEVVIYKMVVSRITAIQKEKEQTYYLLESFGEEPWHFKVPVENVFEHIQKLPSSQEVEEQMTNIGKIPDVTIPRMAIDKCCKPLLESLVMEDWFILLKALFVDKRAAEMAGRKFILKERTYFDSVADKIAGIYSYVLNVDEETARNKLFCAFELALDEL